MADNEDKRPKKSLADQAKELVQGAVEALESLLAPQPELVPVPVRRPRHPYYRR